MRIAIEGLKFDAAGLVPVVVQDAATREVLTLAFMNDASLRRTIETGETWFWSRSRGVLWHKGETSGNTQRIVELHADCDGDALIALVEPQGPACHTGARTCFHNDLEIPARDKVPPETPVGSTGDESRAGDAPPEQASLDSMLEELYAVIKERRRLRPAGSYTTYLFDQGLDKILKKLGEESAETIIAAKNSEVDALVSEASDLLYHLMVLLVERGIDLGRISAELAERRRRKDGAQ